ncbi:hypothetical protein EVAR_4948_1 [Eumeta japonica]|uniref:Uncharacterized protein n=1 Tax=Eumeta variegata TaxID=151549 RepID=A0A4C1V0I3_EUMVA|nr:hypothetical protein EVAR_4948_1 [Eumeta japonica]
MFQKVRSGRNRVRRPQPAAPPFDRVARVAIKEIYCGITNVGGRRWARAGMGPGPGARRRGAGVTHFSGTKPLLLEGAYRIGDRHGRSGGCFSTVSGSIAKKVVYPFRRRTPLIVPMTDIKRECDVLGPSPAPRALSAFGEPGAFASFGVPRKTRLFRLYSDKNKVGSCGGLAVSESFFNMKATSDA